ncbi:MAG: NAD-binding protein [Sulfurospirillaceae bacterium]|nr:NAD-binding protein [Sulfurospirillaceae bacterium]
MISLMLEKTGIPFIVFDQSIKRVRFGRENNHNIFFGHADDIKFLESLHITGALLVVVTVGEEKISRKIVSVIKTNYPSVKVVVRAKDIDDADAIISMGANWAVPEVAEGSIFFGKGVLREMGVSEDSIKILTEELRAGDYQILRGKN